MKKLICKPYAIIQRKVTPKKRVKWLLKCPFCGKNTWVFRSTILNTKGKKCRGCDAEHIPTFGTFKEVENDTHSFRDKKATQKRAIADTSCYRNSHIDDISISSSYTAIIE